jgi:hypothetical protein
VLFGPSFGAERKMLSDISELSPLKERVIEVLAIAHTRV